MSQKWEVLYSGSAVGHDFPSWIRPLPEKSGKGQGEGYKNMAVEPSSHLVDLEIRGFSDQNQRQNHPWQICI